MEAHTKKNVFIKKIAHAILAASNTQKHAIGFMSFIMGFFFVILPSTTTTKKYTNK